AGHPAGRALGAAAFWRASGGGSAAWNRGGAADRGNDQGAFAVARVGRRAVAPDGGPAGFSGSRIGAGMPAGGNPRRGDDETAEHGEHFLSGVGRRGVVGRARFSGSRLFVREYLCEWFGGSGANFVGDGGA